MVLLSDRICERPDPGVCPPMVMPKNMTGFPKPATGPVLTTVKPVVDSSTFSMSSKEAAKLEWTNPVEEEEEGGDRRYDFEGNVVINDERRELYHHGLEASKPGYTLTELFHLSQSGFPSQKTLAIRAIGAIGAKSKASREMHRVLITEWKAHIRCSVACSDTSINVREAAIDALLKLIEGVDKQCGCVASDLSTIPEFLRAFDSDSETSVKVFLHVINQESSSGLTTIHEEEDETDDMIEFIKESAEKFKLDPNQFRCGIATTACIDSGENLGEIVATLCDRIACVDEPICDDDVVYFETKLGEMAAHDVLFDGGIDEFSWTSRCNLVAIALTQSTGNKMVMKFIAKICWLFTSSLFPLECRAAIWGNSELIQNISRISDSMSLLKNHAELDFKLGDVIELQRDKAMILRAIKNACTRFIDESDNESCPEILTAANAILEGVVGKI